jgi:PhzF family phenazine biosynthesis protein
LRWRLVELAHRIVHTTVFAEVRARKSCPVVVDADHLSTRDMQLLAAELRHETAFVLEPRAVGHLWVRYFVSCHEMDVCAHATVAAMQDVGLLNATWRAARAGPNPGAASVPG